MPRIFVGNFEFEHELTGGRRELSRAARAVAADLVSAWVTVAEQDDLVWSPTGIPTFEFQDLIDRGFKLPRFITQESDLPRGPDWQLVPWGWTDHVIAWGQKYDWTCNAPAMALVRMLNSRVFRLQVEQLWSIAPKRATVVHSLGGLADHLAKHFDENEAWVLKAVYGMSGREQFRGQGNQLTDSARNWASRRFQGLTGIVFEPWLNCVEEAGLQWIVPPLGKPQFLGATPLLTDSTGTFRGSQITISQVSLENWQPAIEVTRKIALRLQELGYFGPLGIDAMRHRTAVGEIEIRSVQDLNARYTMGRLALGLHRFVPPGCTGIWLHEKDLVAQAKVQNPNTEVIQITRSSWLVTHPH